MKRGKKRCWKGCKPVPGKKAYSEGSCTCSLSEQRPMVELARVSDKVYQKLRNLTGAQDARAAGDLFRKYGMGYGMEYGWEKKAQKLLRSRANKLRVVTAVGAGVAGAAGYALAKRQSREMSALQQGTIELMRGDFAIPALKRALKRGVGNAGEPVSIHEIGVSGTMIPSLRKNPANVRRATKKYWGEDEGLGQATAAMRYNRDWAAKTIRESRKKNPASGTMLWPIADEHLRSRRFSSLRPGMIEFADSRPRNDMGQYMANETGGADPNSMAAAYGNVEQEKIMRRRSLVQRMKAMIGRNDQQPVMQ